MAIAMPLTYPSDVFEKVRCMKVKCALYTALGFHADDIHHFPTLYHLHDAMHARIASLKAAIAAGGPYEEGRAVCVLYDGTGDTIETDERFWNALMPGLKRLPKAVLIDMAQVLQFRYWPGVHETLSKGDLASIIINHAFIMKTDPQMQRFRAEYLIAPQEQQPEDTVVDQPPQQPDDIVTASPEDTVTDPTALLPGEP